MTKQQKQIISPFSAYQKFAIFILAITQFTVILDFMVMPPLGDILMKSLGLKPSHFGFAVSSGSNLSRELFLETVILNHQRKVTFILT